MDEKKLDKDINVRSKLTDEEIVKALEHCSHNRSCEYCYHNDEAGSGEIVCRARLMVKVLDLIHRLQSENERLTKQHSKLIDEHDEYGNLAVERLIEIEKLKAKIKQLTGANGQLKGYNNGLKYKNAELQKQVDEAKSYAEDIYKKAIDREEDAYSLGFDKGKEQAVKDTAKEIFDDLRNIFIEQSSYGSDANQHIGYYDYEVKMGLVIEQIEEYAKEKYGIEYGVEVE